MRAAFDFYTKSWLTALNQGFMPRRPDQLFTYGAATAHKERDKTSLDTSTTTNLLNAPVLINLPTPYLKDVLPPQLGGVKTFTIV